MRWQVFSILCVVSFAAFGDESTDRPLPVPSKAVVLTFDDAVVSHAAVVAPLLKKYGFQATFFVCEFQPDFDDKTKYMTWEQIALLHREGFEVASHTRSHKHVDKMAPGEFEQELSYIERKCKGVGIPRPRAFAYPAYVSTAQSLRTLREKGYQFARAGESRAYDPAVDDPLLIPSFSTSGTDEKTAQRVFAALRQAKDGKIVVLTIHGVPDSAHPKVTTAPELFERYLKFLSDEKYTVLAMRDLAKYARPASRIGEAASDRYAARLGEVTDANSWRAYFARSDESSARQKSAGAAELRSAGLTAARPAPAGASGDTNAATPPGGSLSSAETRAVIESILSYQLPCGGWSKALDYSRGPRMPGTQWTSGDAPWHYAGTIDNSATTAELRFLAAFWEKTPSDAVKAAVLRGVDYLIEAQYPNGGWPQNYPLEGGYHDFITLNDSAMLKVLQLLDDVVKSRNGMALVDDARRERARAAVERGNDCLFRLQVRGAVWCGQYEPLTLIPAHARLFEPASLSGGESVDIVRYLMRLPKTPERTAAVESALAWFANAETFPDEKGGGQRRWARFYDLSTQRPVFTGKADGRRYSTYEAMRERNPGGYDYLVTKPADLIGKWAARWRSGE